MNGKLEHSVSRLKLLVSLIERALHDPHDWSLVIGDYSIPARWVTDASGPEPCLVLVAQLPCARDLGDVIAYVWHRAESCYAISLGDVRAGDNLEWSLSPLVLAA